MTWGPTNPEQMSGQSPVNPQVAAPAFPATTVFVQNTNPYAVQAFIKVPAAATVTAMYINNTNSTTGAQNPGSNFAATTALNFMIIIPAGWWFRMDYSGGTVTWNWIGGL
ncbi:MAG: hypothetical protein ACJ8BW_23870 [Ktedonobacteraceae bacterium]